MRKADGEDVCVCVCVRRGGKLRGEGVAGVEQPPRLCCTGGEKGVTRPLHHILDGTAN